jgi:hypothetical protein
MARVGPEPPAGRRVEGQLFISVLAYHFMHTIRLRLKARGVNGG